MHRFSDRAAAGRQLATRLLHLRGKDVVVLGLPRGGSRSRSRWPMALGAPLDVLVVRKLGVPFQPELAMGALGEGGVAGAQRARWSDRSGVDPDELAAIEERERAELERRALRFRAGPAPGALTGRTAVIVDDGIATGATARAACQVARAQGAARVVLAVPVCAPQTAALLPGRGGRARRPGDAGGLPRRRPVLRRLPSRPGRRGRAVAAAGGAAPGRPPQAAAFRRCATRTSRWSPGKSAWPATSPSRSTRSGLVVFAHGSGSSRHSPRNRYVAEVLQEGGLATLLFDLLTPAEERRPGATSSTSSCSPGGWRRSAPGCATQPECRPLPLGWFGASTGAGAALWAAAEPGCRRRRRGVARRPARPRRPAARRTSARRRCSSSAARTTSCSS